MTRDMQILITGATGFIGVELVAQLLEQTDATLKLAIRQISRYKIKAYLNHDRIMLTTIPDISIHTNWKEALEDCQVVIHAAGRAHVMQEYAHDPLRAFRAINVEGTLNLARQAVSMGVKRFIYLSSVKVNGEYSERNAPFSPDDEAMPENPYSISKYEAEQGLKAISEKSGMEVVIIRPPLVYGPGVGGNFLFMMKFLEKQYPLPFGALKNKRSLVFVGNLVAMIKTCLAHTQAANQIFFVSDHEDLSTSTLIQKVKHLLGKHAVLLPIPVWMLKKVSTYCGKQSEIMRLCDPLQVDISKSKMLLDWQPTISVNEGLSRTVHYFLKQVK